MGVYDEIFLPPEQRKQPSSAAPAPPISGPATKSIYDDIYTPPPAVAEPTKPPQAAYHGGLLPFSKDSSGHVYFDPLNAGPIGAIKQAFTLPHRVATGETPLPRLGSRDPNAYSAIVPEALNFATAFNPLPASIRAGERAVLPGPANNITRPVRPAPTTSQLFDVGGKQMDQFYDLPMRYNPVHMGTVADTIEQRLINKGIYRDDAKGIYGTLDLMRQSAQPQAAGTNVVIAPSSLHSLRQNMGNKFGREGEHQLAPAIAQQELDKYISNPDAYLAGRPGIGHNSGPAFGDQGIVPLADRGAGAGYAYGNEAQQAGQLFKDALGNMAAGYRGEDFDNLSRKIDLKTAGAHSGRNLDNQTRQQLTGLLLDENKTRGFIPAEETALENAVYGDPTTNRLRDASKVLGGGGGMGMLASGTLGSTAGGFLSEGFGLPHWVGATVGAGLPPAVGRALGTWGAARTQKALNDVADMTRMRSPYYESQPLLPAQVETSPVRDAVTRALMAGPTRPQDDNAPPELYGSPGQ